MTIHLTDPVTVTGAGGGIGSAALAFLRANQPAGRVPPMIYELHRDDALAGQDGALGLVCCHAAPIGSSLSELLEVDVVLTRRAIDARVRGMQSAGRGSIVLFSSIRAQAPRAGQADYATTKSAIEGMTRGLAVDLAPAGITVNAIAPGAVDTPRTRDNIRLGVVKEADLVGPLGRMATAEEIARVVAWLLFAAPPSFTGQVVTVDAGWSVAG